MKGQQIILLTYYWPPAGGIAVQRWLQMSHYLAELGWKITVVTSANPDYPQLDPNLNSKVHPSIQIIRVKGFEPRNFLARFSNFFTKNKKVNLDNSLNQAEKNKGLLQKIILWVRSNWFIPDARIGWANKIAGAIPENQLQTTHLIISTGPPHSTHLAAQQLAARYNLPWVADFRDPWMEIEYFEHLNLSRRSLRRHQSLEAEVLSSADLVTTVSPSWASLFQSKGARRTAVIYNGYDEADFLQIDSEPKRSQDDFIISHLGTLGEDRLVPALFKACNAIVSNQKIPNFRLVFAGNTTAQVHPIATKYNLSKKVTDMGFISHEKAIELMHESALLLLIQNKVEKNIKGRIPAKVFEYMATQKPILMIGDIRSDLADLLSDYLLASIADFEDEDRIYRAILHAYQHKSHPTPPSAVETYARRNCTLQLHDLLMELTTPQQT